MTHFHIQLRLYSHHITILHFKQTSNLKMTEQKKLVSFSEDEYGKRIDRCLTDTLIKGSGGLVLGTVFSLLFFKRRAWPVVLGTGFGIGVAYRSCERDLNS